MKLKTKIILFSSLFMFLLIALVNTSIYLSFYKISSNNELAQLSSQTNTIVERLQAHSDIPKNELLQAFLPANGMIRVVDETNKELIPTITKRQEYRQLDVTFSNAETQKVVENEGTKVAVITKPIIWEDGTVVMLQVANYLIPLEETMRTLSYVLIVASIMMLIPSVVGGSVLSTFVLQPILKLIDTMKENTKDGKWKTINVENRSHDELYEMEMTFNAMIKQIKANYEKQELFVSDASHELKTPISIIKSYAELLKRRGKSHPELFDESVTAIESEADRMKQLVHQMLLLARNKENTHFQPIDMNKLTKKVVQTFTKAYEREILFHSLETPIFVYGNDDQLEQIIYILLDNAIKYSEKDIHVRLLTEEQKMYVEVVDKGQGISARDSKHIFDRFYRVDKARTRTSGGTGLGLAIAKFIAEIHNGKLTVKSEQNIGSTFTLVLPIVKKD